MMIFFVLVYLLESSIDDEDNSRDLTAKIEHICFALKISLSGERRWTGERERFSSLMNFMFNSSSCFFLIVSAMNNRDFPIRLVSSRVERRTQNSKYFIIIIINAHRIPPNVSFVFCTRFDNHIPCLKHSFLRNHSKRTMKKRLTSNNIGWF